MAAETKREPITSTIRPMREDDVSAVARISRSAPEAAFWPESSVSEVLSWGGIVALVSESRNRAVGFLIARETAGEAEILNLAVEHLHRRRGEGAALLNAAAEALRMRGVTRVFLEVRESNAAGIAFYRKHGFSETGRRPSYYREPEEAAVVMEKKLTK
jgi:[ribosomal protein S18]-alanine N-acetyltransferase